MKQYSFVKQKLTYGGSESIGRRHNLRPLCSKRALHLVLKSQGIDFRFPGVSFIQAKELLTEIIENKARKFGISLYSYSINQDHIHMAIRLKHRNDYVMFIRAMTAHIVRTLSRFFGFSLAGIFNLRPWTRVVTWGKAFKHLIKYIELNQLEAAKLISRWRRVKKSHKSPILCYGSLEDEEYSESV